MLAGATAAELLDDVAIGIAVELLDDVAIGIAVELLDDVAIGIAVEPLGKVCFWLGKRLANKILPTMMAKMIKLIVTIFFKMQTPLNEYAIDSRRLRSTDSSKISSLQTGRKDKYLYLPILH